MSGIECYSTQCHSRVLTWVSVLVLGLAVGVLLAPVVVDDPVVSWPQAGEAPRSTMVPLAPYRPLSLDATVPCAALAELSRRAAGGDALRTLPAPAEQGLVVSVHQSPGPGTVQITASGATLLREELPPGECSYRVLADAGGVRVLRDGVQLAGPGLVDPGSGLVGPGSEPVGTGLPVPQVGELATDVEGLSAANGLAVTLHTDARYESTPSALKLGLLLLHGAALLALLSLALRWYGARAGSTRWPRPRVADAVLVAVSAVWVLLSPVNFDDPWYTLMARGAAESGSVSNAIYMFNATENPFVASQYVLQLWGALGQTFSAGWGLLWMRLVPLIYGLLTWVLLRLLLVAGFGRDFGTARAVWALLVAHLLWWLPYGMTLRPEPLIVVFAAMVLLLAELARQRRSVGLLAAATAVAALATTVSPSGLVAAAPLVVALPWLWSWLREQDLSGRVAAVLVLGAAGTALVPVGFADATLGDVLESIAVHQWYYQTFSWYEEFVHYRTVLVLPDSSQWARRAPVVLTVALLVVVAAGSGRRAGDDPVRRLLLGSAVCSAIALGLLAFTPTKWVNHFGAAAAVCTVLIAAALLRSPLPRGVGRIASVAGVALLVGAVSLSFAGPNFWRPHSDRGQPFGDHLNVDDLASMQPAVGPLRLANPAIWVAVAGAVACWVWWWRRRGRASGLTPDRGVLLTGSVALVVLTLVVFVWAPLRQYPGWSVAVTTANGLRGQPCSLATYAQVLVDTPAQPVLAGSASTPSPPVEGSNPGAAAEPAAAPLPPALPVTGTPPTAASPLGTPPTAMPATSAVPTATPATGAPSTASATGMLVGGAFASGAFAAAADHPSPVSPPVPGTLVWHDAAPAAPETGVGPETGLLVTPWFALPASAEASHLLVPLLGTRAGQRMALEYTTETEANPPVTGSAELSADPSVPDTDWQQAAVPLDQLGAQRPSGVRLVVQDQVTGPNSWLAVGQPRLTAPRPLTALTAGQPVYVDQLTATLVPCVDQVNVEHGIAQAAQVRVLADEGFSRGFLELAFEAARGGTQVQADRSATTVRIPAWLAPAGPPTLPWGRVERVIYDHPVGLIDLHVNQVHRAGWTRLPTLASPTYDP